MYEYVDKKNLDEYIFFIFYADDEYVLAYI